MKLFSRPGERLSDRQELLAEKLARRITDRQRQLADWLNLKTAGLSFNGWLLLLIGFCMLFGTYCLWLLVSAF